MPTPIKIQATKLEIPYSLSQLDTKKNEIAALVESLGLTFEGEQNLYNQLIALGIEQVKEGEQYDSIDVSKSAGVAPVTLKVTEQPQVGLSVDTSNGTAIVAVEAVSTLGVTIEPANDIDVQTKEQLSVTVINPNKYVHTQGVQWGDVSGTISSQTDLVDYIDNEISQIPTPTTPTLDDVLTAGNEAREKNIVVKKVGIAYEGSLSYTLPDRDGSQNQVIQTDGLGALRFVDLPASATWGNITGTLSDQTDLDTALDAKEDVSNKSTNVSMGNSDTLYPTQNAVRVFVNNAGIPKENISNKSTDVTMGGVSPSSTLYTSQYAVATYVQNEIAQAQSGIPTFEIDMFANYKLFEYDEDGTTSYLGQIKATNGNWLITKFVDSSGDIAASYANVSNNASYTTMATAWAARTGLTYEDINDLTSI